MTDVDALLRLAHAAVDDAAELMHTRPPGELTPKGERDYVSEVDVVVERTVREHLRARAPGIALVGEEEHAAPTGTSEWWTLDPIAGTVNFAQGVPLCAVSLGLVRDGRPVLGVIDLPFLNARYWAAEERGCAPESHRGDGDCGVIAPEGRAITPQAVTIHRHEPEGSVRDTWQATVTDLEADRDRIRVTLNGAIPITVEVTRAAVVELKPRLSRKS